MRNCDETRKTNYRLRLYWATGWCFTGFFDVQLLCENYHPLGVCTFCTKKNYDFTLTAQFSVSVSLFVVSSKNFFRTHKLVMSKRARIHTQREGKSLCSTFDLHFTLAASCSLASYNCTVSPHFSVFIWKTDGRKCVWKRSACKCRQWNMMFFPIMNLNETIFRKTTINRQRDKTLTHTHTHTLTRW